MTNNKSTMQSVQVGTEVRAKVYEVQQGGFIADYVRYFKTLADVETFKGETGYKVEIIDAVHPVYQLI